LINTHENGGHMHTKIDEATEEALQEFAITEGELKRARDLWTLKKQQAGEDYQEWDKASENRVLCVLVSLFRMGWEEEEIDHELTTAMHTLHFGIPENITVGEALRMARLLKVDFFTAALEVTAKVLLLTSVPSFMTPDEYRVGRYLRIHTDLEWYVCGFPTVKVPPKWVAAAMCTKIPTTSNTEVKPPWSAFKISLPKEPLLYLTSKRNEQLVVSEIYVTKRSLLSMDQWSITICTTTDYHRVYYLKGGEILLDSPKQSDESETAYDSRVLAFRIIVSLIWALTDKKNLTKVNKAEHDHRNDRTGKPTKELEFQLTEPVSVDLREHVKQFQLDQNKKGKGKTLNIQFMVMGHRKMQPYGPGNSLRKQIWIEPYWKGPLDSPVALRPHVVQEPTS